MNYFHKILLTCLFVLGVVTVSAEDKRDMFNPVRNSVTSQTIAPDARAAGMGDVGVATDPDVNSQYWNPAKYPFAISIWLATTVLAIIAPFLVLCATFL